MKNLLISLFAFAPCALSQVTSLTLQTPATALIDQNGQVQSTTTPSGPVNPSGALSASLGGAQVAVDWMSTSLPTFERLRFHNVVYVPAGTPTNASFTGGDFIYHISNPTIVDVEVQLSMLSNNSTGNTVMIDVGDDGSAEFTSNNPTAITTVSLTIGPTPVPIRIHNNSVLVGPGYIDTSLFVSVTPVAGYAITQAVVGCDPGHRQYASPAFDGSLYLGVSGPHTNTQPSVMVIGLSLQPVLLPSPWSFPCLLMPSPDLTVFPGYQPFQLQVPPAARPITLWAQAVVLRPTQLLLTNAVQVAAY